MLDPTTGVLNQVQSVYGSHGQITHSHQDHTDLVGQDTAHQTVEYGYDESVDNGTDNVYSNGLRLETITYPQTNHIVFNDYGDADTISDRLHRIHRIRNANSTGTIFSQYSYNGTSRLAVSDLTYPDVRLDLYQGTAGTYAGYDRFGRTVDQYWYDYTSGTSDRDRFTYTYDYAGNRLTRELTLVNYLDQKYTYDGLHRLVHDQQGNYNGSSFVSTNWQDQYTLDQQGNWTNYKNGPALGWLNQNRTHNVANEITDLSVWMDPAYDAAGNMTTMPAAADPWTTSFTLKYDAWNRLIEVKNGNTQIQKNRG